ncbi:single-stranded DNA-binding protein [bacterium]|jgi:single-strand DNA-binding protein|nr:single-stranded DNA-binding protein [bacterium]
MKMKSLNRVSLLGHLVADPEVRSTQNGNSVANFAIATNRKWKNASGEVKGETDFHRVVAWRKLGQLCGEYLKKGSSVYVEGQLRNRSYDTDAGEKRFTTEIIAKDVNILTWKKGEKGAVDADVQPLNKEEESEE